MKKILSIVLLSFLAVCLFAVGGCKKKEATLEKDVITIHGQVGDKTTVNPVFDWTNEKGDSSFAFLIKDDEDKTVLEDEAQGTHYELTKCLDYGTKYTVVIRGASSGEEHSASFETLAGTGTPRLTVSSLSLSEPYKSYMVLQRGREITVKGSAREHTLITLDFLGALRYAVSDEKGAFSFTLPAMEANATPSDMEFRLLKEKKLVLRDVLVGDVYLVSGQSNIQRTVLQSDCRDEDITAAAAADVRYFKMDLENTSSTPLDTIKGGEWFKMSEGDETYKNYSAISFMLGSMLGTALAESKVPVGIVCATKGDTNIAAWIGKDYYDGSISYKNVHYNAKIYPLRNAEFCGVVWYQGCNNSASGIAYKDLLNSLKANWRALFRKADLPFYVVQLPVFDGDSGNNYDFSYVREAQYLSCEEDENAYLIATCDDGDPKDIHPVHKRYIAERLSKSILSTRYGAAYLPQGPTYLSLAVEGSRAIVSVKNGEGLTSNGEEIRGFQVAGADGKYYAASAMIEGGKIVVTSPKVASPVYVKYGFSKSPFLNVYNKDGFLMSPFRTDKYNRNIDLLDYSEDANYRLHPDGSSMEHTVVTENGETGLRITKADDGKDFGSLILDKYAAIGYKEWGVRFSLIGTNSGAKVLFRIVEGAGEIWAYEITDDFTGKRDFTVSTLDLACVYNRQDGIIDYQKIMDVEVTIRAAHAATVTVLGFAFVDVEKTAPTAFTISEARNDGHECLVKYGQSAFADAYRVIVSADGTAFSSPVFEKTTDLTQVSFDASLCKEGTTYYAKVVALNSLGETLATNSGVRLDGVESRTIQSFAFASDAALQDFVRKNMVVHNDLKLSTDERGMKINVSEKGDWLYCIVNLEQGITAGYDALKFYMDLNEYKGSGVNVQLQCGDANFSYDLNRISKKEGYFEIPLSSFTSGGAAYDGRNVTRIAFNFTNYVGGENDNVLFRDLELVKQ